MRKLLMSTVVLLASAGLVALTGCAGPDEPAVEEPSTSTSQPSTPTPVRSSAPVAPAPSKTTEAPAAEGEQSRSQACTIAKEAVLSVQSAVGAAMANPADKTAVMTALEAVETTLDGALEEISNPEVGTALTDLRQQFVTFGQLIDRAGGAGQATQIQSAMAELRGAMQRVQTLCP